MRSSRSTAETSSGISSPPGFGTRPPGLNMLRERRRRMWYVRRCSALSIAPGLRFRINSCENIESRIRSASPWTSLEGRIRSSSKNLRISVDSSLSWRVPRVVGLLAAGLLAELQPRRRWAVVVIVVVSPHPRPRLLRHRPHREEQIEEPVERRGVLPVLHERRPQRVLHRLALPDARVAAGRCRASMLSAGETLRRWSLRTWTKSLTTVSTRYPASARACGRSGASRTSPLRGSRRSVWSGRGAWCRRRSRRGGRASSRRRGRAWRSR